MGGKLALTNTIRSSPLGEVSAEWLTEGSMEVTGSSDAYRRARKLRREMTKPERLLWWALKADKTGFHFRRQHAAGPYVLDFYCDRVKLTDRRTS